jgi:UDP-glucose 4-epimerase
MHRFDAVIHFAGRKAVGESVEFPMLYYTHNVAGAVNLIEAMRKHNCKNVSRPAGAMHYSMRFRTS